MTELKNFPNYFVTKKGLVFSLKSNRFLKPRPLPTGYLRVSIGSPPKDFYIHRLIAQTFLRKPKGKNFVNHKNGDKRDNRVRNIQWVTCKENSIHMVDILRKGFGDLRPNAKMTNTQVKEIKNRLKLKERPAHLAKGFNVSRKAICNIKHGKSWRKVA